MNNAEFNLAEESCSAGSVVSASSALWTWPNHKFRNGTKIAPFVGDLKYTMEQDEAIESIAVNHVLSSTGWQAQRQKRSYRILSI